MRRRAADAVFAGALGLVVAGYGHWIWRPALKAGAEAKARLHRTEAEIRKSEDFTRGVEDLQRCLEDFEEALRELDTLVPARIDADERVREVSEVITRSGLSDDAILPKESSPRGAVTAHPLTVHVRGSYAQLLRFLYAAEALPRHTRVTRLQIKPGTQAQGELSAEVELTSYSVAAAEATP